jgi:DNA repair protein RadA/Sms
VDAGRVNMLCAVLARRAGLDLGGQDVYVNVSGGVRVEERAADLGVALAVASALRDKPVGLGTACFGEVGLTGDLRFVPGDARRVGELLKMGFGRIIKPEGVSEGGSGSSPDGAANGKPGSRGKSLVEVKTLEEAVAVALL